MAIMLVIIMMVIVMISDLDLDNFQNAIVDMAGCVEGHGCHDRSVVSVPTVVYVLAKSRNDAVMCIMQA